MFDKSRNLRKGSAWTLLRTITFGRKWDVDASKFQEECFHYFFIILIIEKVRMMDETSPHRRSRATTFKA